MIYCEIICIVCNRSTAFLYNTFFCIVFQFLFQPFTALINPRLQAVERFFNIANWPRQIVSFDLGGRVLDIIPIPGHEPSSISVYDRQTGLSLSGDSLYPGNDMCVMCVFGVFLLCLSVFGVLCCVMAHFLVLAQKTYNLHNKQNIPHIHDEYTTNTYS